MELQLDTANDSSGRGRIFRSNGDLNAPPSHSPLSNDSGFHSDRIPQGQQNPHNPHLATKPLRTKNIKHKPTYDSVFATDLETNSIFDKYDKVFQTSRPDCLTNRLLVSNGEDEKLAKCPVAAPIIAPSRMSTSTSSCKSSSPFMSLRPETTEPAFTSASLRPQAETINTSCSFSENWKSEQLSRSGEAHTPGLYPSNQNESDAGRFDNGCEEGIEEGLKSYFTVSDASCTTSRKREANFPAKESQIQMLVPPRAPPPPVPYSMQIAQSSVPKSVEIHLRDSSDVRNLPVNEPPLGVPSVELKRSTELSAEENTVSGFSSTIRESSSIHDSIRIRNGSQDGAHRMTAQIPYSPSDGSSPLRGTVFGEIPQTVLVYDDQELGAAKLLSHFSGTTGTDSEAFHEPPTERIRVVPAKTPIEQNETPELALEPDSELDFQPTSALSTTERQDFGWKAPRNYEAAIFETRATERPETECPSNGSDHMYSSDNVAEQESTRYPGNYTRSREINLLDLETDHIYPQDVPGYPHDRGGQKSPENEYEVTNVLSKDTEMSGEKFTFSEPLSISKKRNEEDSYQLELEMEHNRRTKDDHHIFERQEEVRDEELPNIPLKHHDIAAFETSTRSSTVSPVTPTSAVTLSKFSWSSVNEINSASRKAALQTDSRSVSGKEENISWNRERPLKTYQTRSYTELNAAPRRKLTNETVKPSPSTSFNEPILSSRQENKRTVPVNKLIARFSQNDNGTPVMPVPHGIKPKVGTFTQRASNTSSSSSSGRRLQTSSEWSVSSAIHSTSTRPHDLPRDSSKHIDDWTRSASTAGNASRDSRQASRDSRHAGRDSVFGDRKLSSDRDFAPRAAATHISSVSMERRESAPIEDTWRTRRTVSSTSSKITGIDSSKPVSISARETGAEKTSQRLSKDVELASDKLGFSARGQASSLYPDLTDRMKDLRREEDAMTENIRDFEKWTEKIGFSEKSGVGKSEELGATKRTVSTEATALITDDLLEQRESPIQFTVTGEIPCSNLALEPELNERNSTDRSPSGNGSCSHQRQKSSDSLLQQKYPYSDAREKSSASLVFERSSAPLALQKTSDSILYEQRSYSHAREKSSASLLSEKSSDSLLSEKHSYSSLRADISAPLDFEKSSVPLDPEKTSDSILSEQRSYSHVREKSSASLGSEKSSDSGIPDKTLSSRILGRSSDFDRPFKLLDSADMKETRVEKNVDSWSRNGRTEISKTSTVTAMETSRTESSQKSAFVGLDFSRYDVTEDDIIGRPTEADEAERSAMLSTDQISSISEASARIDPTKEQLAECEAILGSHAFHDYDVFAVNLRRSNSSLEGSVGVILTSCPTGEQFIMVHKVTSGSIADHSNCIDRGDRVFFIQGRSTKMMTTSEARSLMKSPAPSVTFVLGRQHNTELLNPAPLELFSTVSIDPDRFHYSTTAEEVILTKDNLGVGLALHGGKGSIYGDRPIVVKRIFAGGSAAKSGRIRVGDQIAAIDGVSMNELSYLNATQTLRSRPKGDVTLTIYSRL